MVILRRLWFPNRERVLRLSYFGTCLIGLCLSTSRLGYLKVLPGRLVETLKLFNIAIMTVQSNGVPKPSALPLVQKLSKDHDIVLKTFRLLIADLCQQFSGGHPG